MSRILPLVALGWHAAVAVAEVQSGKDLETVVIIGRTVLDDVGVPVTKLPANVQSLGADSLRSQGASTLADLLNENLGSVTVSNGVGNPFQNDINYRGFQATSLLGAPVGLSVHLDGVRMNEPFGSNVNWDLIPMNAISRLELLPGSNPMFGLNTLGGALVVHTKNGKDDEGLLIGGEGGSFGRRAAEFEAGWNDAVHAADYFLSGAVDGQDGYREHSASRVKQLYGKARWHGRDNRSVLEVSAGLAASRLSGTQSLPLDMMADRRAAYTLPDTADNRAAFLSIKGSSWLSDTDRLAGDLHYRGMRSRNSNSNAQLDDGCFAEDGGLAPSTTPGLATYQCANQAPNGTALNAVTGANALALGYGRWTSSINSSVVASATKEGTLGTALQWSRSANVWGHANMLSVGANVEQSRVGFEQDSSLARLVDYATIVMPNLAYGFTANGAMPSAANPPAFTGSNLLSSVRLHATSRDGAAWFTDTLDATDRLALTASGSFNSSTLDQAGRNAQYLNDDGGYAWTDGVSGVRYYNPGYVTAYKYANTGAGAAAAPLGVPPAGVAGPESHALDGRHAYHRFNPALGFTYQLAGRTGLFGGYSESLRAPTSIELSCADPYNPCSLPTGFNGDPDLKPVVARTVELGARGKLAGAVDWNLAAYQSRLQDDIQFIATSNTYGYFANVGTTERRGVELGMQARLGKLGLAAQYGRVEARYRSAFTTAAGQDVVSGNRIPGIPDASFKLHATYTVLPALDFGGTLVVAGGQYSHGNESNQDPAGMLGGYAIVNLDLAYRLSDSLRMSVHVGNALDRRYETYGLSGTRSLYSLVEQPFLTPAPPRAIRVGMTFSMP